MFSKIKLFRITVMLSAALFLTLAAAPASAERLSAQMGTKVTKIRVNGISAHGFLLDSSDNTQGFVFPTKDEIANTAALDFGYSTPHPTEPGVYIVYQGAGEIPNDSFTIDLDAAHLSVTTGDSYNVTRCIFNEVTGDLTCDFDSGIPITFNLTWIANGVGSTFEKIKQIETFGPFTTKYAAEFISRSAIVTGTWGGHTNDAMSGSLRDNGNKTFIREVTVHSNP